MTAGVIIPCMPSLAALVRHIRPSVSTYFGKYRNIFRGLIQSHKQTETCDNDTTKAFSAEHEYKGKYVPMVDESVHSAQVSAARVKISHPLPYLNPHGQIRAPYKANGRGIRPPGAAM